MDEDLRKAKEEFLNRMENAPALSPTEYVGMFQSYADMEPAMDRALTMAIESKDIRIMQYVVNGIRSLMCAGVCPFTDGESHELYFTALILVSDLEKEKEAAAA